MGKFIVVGNSHLPVNTAAERALAGRAVSKQANETNIEVATVYVGAPGFADETGQVLDCDGALLSIMANAKPLPYCARCQANDGSRCGICDEADYIDGSGRRQRNTRQVLTHIADALQALDDAVLTFEDAAAAIMLLKRATEVTKQAVALGATQEQLAPVAESLAEAQLVFQCRGWA